MDVEAILLERETQGLKAPVIGRMVLGLFAISVMTATSLSLSDRGELWIAGYLSFIATMGAMVVVNAVLLVFLMKRRHVRAVGLIGAVFDAVTVAAQIVGGTLSLGSYGLKLGAVFETPMPTAVCLMLAIDGLALRPRYPLIVTIGTAVSFLATFIAIALSPETKFASHPLEVFQGDGIDPAQLFAMMFMVIGTGVAVTFITHVARKTIVLAVGQELENERLRREQMRVVMREKVQGLAKLVAGLSHEINNPIGVIKSSVDTQRRAIEKLTEKVDPNDRVLKAARDSITTMTQAVERISQTEASLRAFAHLDESDFQKVDLHVEVENVLRILNPGPTRIERDFGAIPSLYLNAKEMNQLLLTILRNAFEAVSGAGTVTIRTSIVAEYVELAIADDGRGIPEDQLATLFDVSLRAKERVVAKFGLPAAQSVALRHGGEIAVVSEVGQGSTFTLRLPIVA